jgi:hypothetical protein
MTPSPDNRASTLARLAKELNAEAERELAEARDRNVEVSMLAHKWMAAHDMLAAGKPYDFPTPADVPNSIARADSLQAQLSALQSEIERKDAALEQCRQQFAFYASQHTAKHTEDGDRKAETNLAMTDVCARALSPSPKETGA